MGRILRTTALLLVYPFLIVGARSRWNTPQRFATWGMASMIGIAVFVVLFAELPATFSFLEVEARIARPLTAYLGGLAATAFIVLLTRRRAA